MPLLCLNCLSEQVENSPSTTICHVCRMPGMLWKKPDTIKNKGVAITPLVIARHANCHNCGESFAGSKLPSECPACRMPVTKNDIGMQPGAGDDLGSAVSDSSYFLNKPAKNV